MNKYQTNLFVQDAIKEVKIPKTIGISSTENFNEQMKALIGEEIVVKPGALGASIFTEKYHCSRENLDEIKKLVDKILKYDSKALVQQYIAGTEYSCGCLERNNNVEVLPLVRIDTDQGFFGHDQKHKLGLSKEVIINSEEDTVLLKKIKSIAKEIFIQLGIENICRFDFIVRNDEIFFLEVNALPGLMENSIFPKMLKAIGLDVVDLINNSYLNNMNRKQKSTDLSYKID